MRKKFPGIKLGFSVLRGVKVVKTHPGLDELRKKLWKGLDFDKIKLPIELRFAKGGELFQGLGTTEAVRIMPGELCYFDATGIAMARDFNYFDSELTKVDEKTTNLLLNIDGNGACSFFDVENCLKELEQLLQKFCGGKLAQRVLTI